MDSVKTAALNERLSQNEQAHDFLVSLYTERAMAAADRGDFHVAERWADRVEAARSRTDEHALSIRMTA